MQNNTVTFADIDQLLVKIAGHKSFVLEKEAVMNAHIQEVKELYNVETKDSNAAIAQLEVELEALSTSLKIELKDKKSKELTHGKIGFRTGTPKVLRLSKKYNIATSLELAKKLFKKRFIRIKEELNKEAIIAEHSEKKISDQQVAAMGLRIDQDEKFFYEIDWEKLEN